MKRTVENATRLEGILKVPGDKSIAHRALILGAAARGRQVIDGMPDARDVLTTVEALRAMGCFVESMPDGRTIVLPNALRGTFEIDAGNSGTTARLLAGFAAGFAQRCSIDGDDSLRRRPMARIAEPLARMGARVVLAEGGTLPATIEGGALRGIEYTLPVPSAQVKSAILIAGLFADGVTSVVEPVPTRDHTEIMMTTMGVEPERNGTRISVRGGSRLEGTHVTLPGDISSAAFFLVGASIRPGSRIHLPFTGVNPRRTGIITVLQAMGADITVEESQGACEVTADITVQSAPLHGVEIDDPALVASIIDEIPVLAVAATQAEGVTTIRGAGELRHKESDRIGAMVSNLCALGARAEALEDGLAIEGPVALRGAPVASHGDHRIAMAMAVAALAAEGATQIEGAEAAEVSYPRFFDDLRAVAREH